MTLIDKDALKKDILDLPNCYNGFSDAYDKSCIIGVIDEQPTIEERKTGKWISLDDSRGKYNDYGYKCSECGEHSDYEENFCPNCGADMRGEQHETN